MLVEIAARELATYSRLVEQTTATKDAVDISRVEAVRFFRPSDAVNRVDLKEVWAAAPEVAGGRAFTTWLTPFNTAEAAEGLISKFESLRERVVIAPPPLLSDLSERSEGLDRITRRLLVVGRSGGDRINLALREYRQKRRSRSTLILPSQDALISLVASGTVYRIEPVHPISSTSPGAGREPNRPYPRDMSALPTVGVVDGGLTAASYIPAEAWRAPPLMLDTLADTMHGNRVTSLVVQGHDWNNNLSLPPLYCQVGTVQAVPKKSVAAFLDPQELIAYLDAVMAAHPETKVWNFSFNQPEDCHLDSVSALGHDLSIRARKHRILPVVSVGNKPGDRLQAPADCEAAITVGGRSHDNGGEPAGVCPVSHCGPGPSSMLKPDVSHFSEVRALGGTVIRGSSFATALTSSLAAHTMQRLREASPDLAKALLLHTSDIGNYDPSLGFGTPRANFLPWQCRPGFVTLQWSAALRPGAAFYWEIPIPLSLRKSGKLKGAGVLTAILNPHPLVTDYAGPHYFSARIETALQFRRGQNRLGSPRYNNLLGSLDTDRITEAEARAQDHKWSPIRHHQRDFQGVSFDGSNLRVYSRIFVRDLYLYGLTSAAEVPELDTVFTLTLGTGEEQDDVYGEVRSDLGSFVEAGTIDAEIEVEQ